MAAGTFKFSYSKDNDKGPARHTPKVVFRGLIEVHENKNGPQSAAHLVKKLVGRRPPGMMFGVVLSEIVRMGHRDDHIAFFMSRFDITVRLDDLLHRITPINDGF